MPELLLELRSEEIPARMQARAAADLERLVTRGLEEAGLAFEGSEAFSTPRRLALFVRGLAEAQPDEDIERRGPRVGAPQAALEGFLRSLGTDDYVLEERDDPKGAVHVARFTRIGRPTPELLPELVTGILQRFPWPKSMRWGAHDVRWVRPLKGIVCIFDGRVVPMRFGPVEASDVTVGHPFMAPDSIQARDSAHYAEALREARVVLDPKDRARIIGTEAARLAEGRGLLCRPDPHLIDELAALTEWPKPLMGSIDPDFMTLPQEVLVTTMRNHQRYIATQDRDGNLAPHFIAVADIETGDSAHAIIAGYERVLRARLWDARFFWDQDRKHSLESRLPGLEAMVFHAKLGTMAARALRLEALAASLAAHVPGASREAVARAASLCKADLVTGMVGEFPELQGTMGRYYALHDGDPPEIADAIAEHYAPRGPDDACPTAPVSVTVALADKIDALVGLFAAGERPTGSKDPFALRRAALGVIRLVLENNIQLPLTPVFRRALELYGEHIERSDHDAVAGDVRKFCVERLRVHMRERGVRHDLISAVFHDETDDDLSNLVARARALQEFLASEHGSALLAGFRRASNIVRIESKKDRRSYDGEPDPTAFELAEERVLYETLTDVRTRAAKALEKLGQNGSHAPFVDAMHTLVQLRNPIDGFFDHVRVNVDDPGLRANRLRLLESTRGVFKTIAELDLIEDTPITTGSAGIAS